MSLLRAQIFAAWNQFQAISQQYRNAIEIVNDQQQLALLQKIEKSQGKGGDYYSLFTMVTSKSLNKTITQNTFDTEKALAITNELQTAIDELKKQKDSDASNTFFISAIEDYESGCEK